MPPNKICWNSFWIMKNTCSKATVKLVSPKLWKARAGSRCLSRRVWRCAACLAEIASASPLVSALGGPASSPTSWASASGVSKNSSSMAWVRKDTAYSVPLLPGARLTSVWHPTGNNWWRYPGSCFFQAAQHPAHHLRFKQSRAVPFRSRPSGQLVMPHPCKDQAKTERSETAKRGEPCSNSRPMGQSPGRWYPKPAWTPQSIQQTVGPLFLTSSTCPAYDSSPSSLTVSFPSCTQVLLTAKKTRSVAGKKLAKLEASAAGFGKWSSKSNIFPTYLFPLVLRRLLPKKQFCTCQLSRCACHASRGCCSSHVDGGHISTAAKPKNKSQKNKKEQHTELLQRGRGAKGKQNGSKWFQIHFQCWIIWIHMATATGGSRQKAPLSGWIQPSFPCSRPNRWSSACHRCPFCSRESCAPQWQRLVLLEDSRRKNSRKHKVEVSLQEDAWHVQLNSKLFRKVIAFKVPPLPSGAAKHHTPQLPPPDSPFGSKRALSTILTWLAQTNTDIYFDFLQ